jgi:hypothetical protein
LEHDVAALEKDKVAQAKFVTDLEKQHEWIRDEHQWVIISSFLNLLDILSKIVWQTRLTV